MRNCWLTRAIEAVYLPFPNGLHAEWIIAAAEAGKDILCEKPLVGSLEDYARVVEACERNGVSLMEAFMYRFHPQHQKVREFIDAGRIGQIVSMHARFHFVMDRSPGEVRLQAGLEGGAVNDVGCYAVDIMNMVMGRAPVSVYAKGTSPADPVETTVAAILDYDGVIGTLDCGFEGPRTNTFQIIGTKGQITLDKAFDPDPGGPGTGDRFAPGRQHRGLRCHRGPVQGRNRTVQHLGPQRRARGCPSGTDRAEPGRPARHP